MSSHDLWKDKVASTPWPSPLGLPLASGRTAEIYPWHDGQILKLYRAWCPRNWVDYEARIAYIVQDAGLAVPRVGDMVDVDGRAGLVFERVDGLSMLRTMEAVPWRSGSLARRMAELQAAVHGCPAPELPSVKTRLEHDITAAPGLPGDLRQAALQRLHSLSDGDSLCHGDLHPDNIIMTSRGPIIIDWMTAARGDPLSDVARSLLLMDVGPAMLPQPRRTLVRLVVLLFRSSYVKRYFEVRPGGRAALTAWQPLVAAARLNEKVPGEAERLIGMVESGLRSR